MRFLIPIFNKWTGSLNATDRLLVSFWGFLACVSLAFCSRIPHWPLLILANLAAVVLVCTIAYTAQLKKWGWLLWIHDWCAFPLVLFSYKLLYFIIKPFHRGRDFDSLLIAADRWLFGIDPAELLIRISHPLLTELLQVAYTIFYLYFIVIGIEIYRKFENKPFRYFRFSLAYGFIISYIGYFFLPATGPRFILYEFSKIDTELPGLLFTPALRRFVNFFESIPPNVPDSIAQMAAQRDVFPSGHTMLTVMMIFLAYQYRLKVRHPLLIAGLLLIFATVYLRYHYLVDIIAGAGLALLCLATSRRLYNAFGNTNGSHQGQDM